MQSAVQACGLSVRREKRAEGACVNALTPDERASSPVVPSHARTASVPHRGIPPRSSAENARWLRHLLGSLGGAPAPWQGRSPGRGSVQRVLARTRGVDVRTGARSGRSDGHVDGRPRLRMARRLTPSGPGGGQGGQQAEKFARGDLRNALVGGELLNESPPLHDRSAAGDDLPEFARRRRGCAARSPTVASVRPPDPMTLKTSGP